MSSIDRGQVRDGVIILPRDAAVIEGAEVFVVPRADPARELGLQPAATIWETLSALDKAIEATPCEPSADLALHHDQYLHCAPKKP